MSKDLIAETTKQRRKKGVDKGFNKVQDASKKSEESPMTLRQLKECYKVLKDHDIFEEVLQPVKQSEIIANDIPEKINKFQNGDTNSLTDEDRALIKKVLDSDEFISSGIYISDLEAVSEIVAIMTNKSLKEVEEMDFMELKSRFSIMFLGSINRKRILN